MQMEKFMAMSHEEYEAYYKDEEDEEQEEYDPYEDLTKKHDWESRAEWLQEIYMNGDAVEEILSLEQTIVELESQKKKLTKKIKRLKKQSD